MNYCIAYADQNELLTLSETLPFMMRELKR